MMMMMIDKENIGESERERENRVRKWDIVKTYQYNNIYPKTLYTLATNDSTVFGE